MKLLDTSAWVEYFKGTAKGEIVKQYLKEENVYTSAITLAEITKWGVENNNDCVIIVSQIKTNSIIILVEEEVLLNAGKLYVQLRKLKPKIGLIDTIIYASALLHDLTLISCDRDFSDLPNVELI